MTETNQNTNYNNFPDSQNPNSSSIIILIHQKMSIENKKTEK